MAPPRISRVFGAVALGSFRTAAIIAGHSEAGELVVLGSGHRAAQGVKRGYVIDMPAATHAVRDAIERAERMAGTSLGSIIIGCSGAGLASHIASIELETGGRRIDTDDIDHLLAAAREAIRPEGHVVLHAQPTHYTLDGAHDVANPRGLHAQRLGVSVHVMLADGAPLRNLTEAVQNAHLDVEAVVAAPVAAGHACLTPEERELGVALIDYGAEVTHVAVYAAGILVGMTTLPIGSGAITDAIAATLGIRRFQAERLKCVHGSAIATLADHREMIPVAGPGEEALIPATHHVANGYIDADNRIARAELVGVITGELGRLMQAIGQALKAMDFIGARGQQVVLTGGGAELAGLADFAQSALARHVRIGRPPLLTGLPEAHASPGFATLIGLMLYAAADPPDLRRLGSGRQRGAGALQPGMIARVAQALRGYF